MGVGASPCPLLPEHRTTEYGRTTPRTAVDGPPADGVAIGSLDVLSLAPLSRDRSSYGVTLMYTRKVS